MSLDLARVDAHFLDAGSACQLSELDSWGQHMVVWKCPKPPEGVNHDEYYWALSKEALLDSLYNVTEGCYGPVEIVLSSHYSPNDPEVLVKYPCILFDFSPVLGIIGNFAGPMQYEMENSDAPDVFGLFMNDLERMALAARWRAPKTPQFPNGPFEVFVDNVSFLTLWRFLVTEWNDDYDTEWDLLGQLDIEDKAFQAAARLPTDKEVKKPDIVVPARNLWA